MSDDIIVDAKSKNVALMNESDFESESEHEKVSLGLLVKSYLLLHIINSALSFVI